MRQVAGRTIWIGNAGDLREPQRVLSAEIRAVFELADSEVPATLPRELIHCRVPLADSGGNPPWLLRFAINSLTELLRANVPTLVCCSNGMSRSVCIAAAALAVLDAIRLEEALAKLASGGSADVSPQFFADVRKCLEQPTDFCGQ